MRGVLGAAEQPGAIMISCGDVAVMSSAVSTCNVNS